MIKCVKYIENLIKGENYPPYKNGLPEYAKLKHPLVKKNLKKDVEILYASFKKFKETHSNAEEIKEFKMACDKVILAAQKSHTEIKEKVYTIYDKKK